MLLDIGEGHAERLILMNREMARLLATSLSRPIIGASAWPPTQTMGRLGIEGATPEPLERLNEKHLRIRLRLVGSSRVPTVVCLHQGAPGTTQRVVPSFTKTPCTSSGPDMLPNTNSRVTPRPVIRAMKDVGDNICTWRLLQRLTAQQVADRAGLNVNTVSSLENGNGASLKNTFRVGSGARPT